MAQLMTRVDDTLIADLDDIVSSGEFKTRSDAVRSAIEHMLTERRRRLEGEAIVEGYRRLPESEEEMLWAAQNARDMVAEEPWERW
ncbi:ribbon-helix-helix domain-containing protein [Candidatus Poriferisodalis sp.]|uniref:ribbon-helix-helix domain-containing protein n=1 Tax=Candidatus Poriferisodalis sp. TaxID=3101277 RepID=UPI003B019AD5